ncbi:hypothetical protein FF38_11006 [Lucilia cuprina]|uniref:Uncharacterized protein n=1 Tax=Lucilia cuprina TaxID=7375 RepID=A0A0L0C1I2_LUCCU|nr:hypothetical protein FF38_11006 [Lucilia cuprina]
MSSEALRRVFCRMVARCFVAVTDGDIIFDDGNIDGRTLSMPEVSGGLSCDPTSGGSQSSTSIEQSSIRYTYNHFGEFLVVCDTSRSKAKKDFNFKGISVISHIGRTLFRIKFDSAADANFFVSYDFVLLGYKAFIPRSFVYSYGVVRGIPFWYTDEYIKKRPEQCNMYPQRTLLDHTDNVTIWRIQELKRKLT